MGEIVIILILILLNGIFVVLPADSCTYKKRNIIG